MSGSNGPPFERGLIGSAWRVARDHGVVVLAMLAIGALIGPVEGQQAPQWDVRKLAAGQESIPQPRIASRVGISGVVRIVPGLVDRIESGDVLFVYAQAVDGDPTPLAVLRKRAHELPVAFFLDDSTAINPTRLPSRHNELVIGARVARRGSAGTPAPGDFQGLSTPVRYGQAGVVIVIDSEVK